MCTISLTTWLLFSIRVELFVKVILAQFGKISHLSNVVPHPCFFLFLSVPYLNCWVSFQAYVGAMSHHFFHFFLSCHTQQIWKSWKHAYLRLMQSPELQVNRSGKQLDKVKVTFVPCPRSHSGRWEPVSQSCLPMGTWKCGTSLLNEQGWFMIGR